jgi:flavorubredoxin
LGGGAVRMIEPELKNSGIEMIEPEIEVKFRPSEEELKRCWPLGRQLEFVAKNK